MTQTIVRGKVGKDGMLRLAVPFDAGDADLEAKVTIELESQAKSMSQEEWHRRIMATAGCITDPAFKRYPQGVPEVREPLD